MKIKIAIITISLIFILFSCDDKTEKVNIVTGDDIITNPTTEPYKWIKELMDEVYLWEAHIPENSELNEEGLPNDYFASLLYEEDHWSWISNDYYQTSNLLNGVSTTAGHTFRLYLRNDRTSVFGIIEYVMQGSPADLAGITRGEVFSSINHTGLNIDNYAYLLTEGSSYTIEFDPPQPNLTAHRENQSNPYKSIEITEAENFQENPIYIDTVYEIEGHRIAYFMYNSFQHSYNDAKDDIFLEFKNQNVTDLIIDLRYNLGGYVLAEEHLANLICPASKVGETFKIAVYNDLLTEYFTDLFGEDYLITKIEENPNSIDLSGQLVGITTESSASASEALLNGLSPLVDFTQIGTTTHGKYTTIAAFPNEDSSWVALPIFAKHTNSINHSVKGGLQPDITIEDNPLDGYPLGDIRETMLNKAIENITGIATTRSIHTTSNQESLGRFRDGKRIKAMPSITTLKE